MTDRRHDDERTNMQVQSAVAPMTRIVHDMNDTLKEHIKKERERIDSIDARLDRHLEIYANNGKESKRVADALEKLIVQHKEMYDLFDTLKGGKTTIKWLFGVFVAIGSATLLVKQLLK